MVSVLFLSVLAYSGLNHPLAKHLDTLGSPSLLLRTPGNLACLHFLAGLYDMVFTALSAYQECLCCSSDKISSHITFNYSNFPFDLMCLMCYKNFSYE